MQIYRCIAWMYACGMQSAGCALLHCIDNRFSNIWNVEQHTVATPKEHDMCAELTAQAKVLLCQGQEHAQAGLRCA